jgi:hypothetical protein
MLEPKFNHDLANKKLNQRSWIQNHPPNRLINYGYLMVQDYQEGFENNAKDDYITWLNL